MNLRRVRLNYRRPRLLPRILFIDVLDLLRRLWQGEEVSRG